MMRKGQNPCSGSGAGVSRLGAVSANPIQPAVDVESQVHAVPASVC